MKKSITHSLNYFLLLSLSLGSCEKKSINDGNVPGLPTTLATSGVLCTIGINTMGKLDTLSYRYSGIDHMTTYNKGFTKPGDEVSFTNNSNNTVSIEKKAPYVYNGKNYFYFAIAKNNGPNPLFPSHAYTFPALKDLKSAETEFIITRNPVDSKKFTIESKAFPGQFLGTAKWQNATYPNEGYLVFTTKKQEFFFLPD